MPFEKEQWHIRIQSKVVGNTNFKGGSSAMTFFAHTKKIYNKIRPQI